MFHMLKNQDYLYSIQIEVPTLFYRYADSVAVRLMARYEELNMIFNGKILEIFSYKKIDENKFKREIMEALYKEKIYNETLAMREIFIRSVMS